ncbi:MAG: VanW family protein [Chitinophagales bacterium]
MFKGLYKRLILLCSIVIFTVGLTVLASSKILAYNDTGLVPPGVKVCGIEIGNLPLKQALERLQNNLLDQGGRYLEFTNDRNELMARLPIDKYGIRYDYDKTLNQATSLETLDYFKRITYHSWVRGGSLSITPVLSWNTDNLPELMLDLRKQVDKSAGNARVIYQDDSLEYISHYNGYVVDVEETSHRVERAIEQGTLHIKLKTRTIYPAVRIDDIRSVKDLMAVYVTTFDPHQENRTHNLRTACSAVDGTIIMPGETFSLNKVLGPRDKKHGYVNAPVLSNGKVATGVGGGICQVATTIYNCVIQTDLEVVEREHHSIPINYVSPGLDATIAGDTSDLRFRNNAKNPVLVSIKVQDNKLVARIFGCQTDPERQIKVITEKSLILPEVKTEYDKSLPAGTKQVKEPGVKGYKAKTFRVVVKNGHQIEKKLLSEDYYHAKDTVILIGPEFKPGIAK